MAGFVKADQWLKPRTLFYSTHHTLNIIDYTYGLNAKLASYKIQD